MKIEEIEVFPLKIPFKMAARIASFEFPYVESMLVKIRTNDNLFGYGEAVTDPPFTGEIIDSISGAIKNYLGRAVLGSNPFALREIHEKMDQALVKNTAAKAAVEMACLEVLGKATGEPLYNTLRQMGMRNCAARLLRCARTWIRIGSWKQLALARPTSSQQTS